MKGQQEKKVDSGTVHCRNGEHLTLVQDIPSQTNQIDMLTDAISNQLNFALRSIPQLDNSISAKLIFIHTKNKAGNQVANSQVNAHIKNLY